MVPPKFRRAGAPLAFLLCGKGTAPVSGAAGGTVFAGAEPWGPLNQGALLCRGVFRLLVTRHRGEWSYGTLFLGKGQEIKLPAARLVVAKYAKLRFRRAATGRPYGWEE